MMTLYDLLNVRPDADGEGIKRAFRKAAKTCHPDLHGDDPEATTRFQELVAARAVLRDPTRRSAYDLALRCERQRRRKEWALATLRVTIAIAVGVVSGNLLFLAGRATPVPPHDSRIDEQTLVIDEPESNAASALVVGRVRTGETIGRAAPASDRGVEQVVALLSYSDPDTVVASSPQNVPKEVAEQEKLEPVIERQANAASGPAAASGPETIQKGIAEQEKAGPAAEPPINSAPGVVAAIDPEAVHKEVAEREKAAPIVDRLNSSVPEAIAATRPQTASEQVAKHEKIDDVAGGGAKHYRDEANVACRHGNFEQAMSALDRVIALDPDDAWAYHARGNLKDETGDPDGALSDYDQAIRLEATSLVYRDRAILWQRMGALDKAIVDFDRAVRFTFSDPLIYVDRGFVWFQKGRHDRAAADFDRAVKIDAGLAEFYVNHGVMRHGDGACTRADGRIDRAAAVDARILTPVLRAKFSH